MHGGRNNQRHLVDDLEAKRTKLGHLLDSEERTAG